MNKKMIGVGGISTLSLPDGGVEGQGYWLPSRVGMEHDEVDSVVLMDMGYDDGRGMHGIVARREGYGRFSFDVQFANEGQRIADAMVISNGNSLQHNPSQATTTKGLPASLIHQVIS